MAQRRDGRSSRYEDHRRHDSLGDYRTEYTVKRPTLDPRSSRHANDYPETRYQSSQSHSTSHPASRLDDATRQFQRLTTNPRQQPAWPPRPTCEDEKSSLQREAGGQRLCQQLVQEDGVLSRGSVDQDPIILDVPELINKDERRFVLAGSGIPTPPSSGDEKARKLRRKPSRLVIESEDMAPEILGRTASPYTFTPQRASHELRTGDHVQPLQNSSNLRVPRTMASPATRSAPVSPERHTISGMPSMPGREDFTSATPTEASFASARPNHPLASARRPEQTGSVQQPATFDFPPQTSGQVDNSSRPTSSHHRRNTDTANNSGLATKLRSEANRLSTPFSPAADSGPLPQSRQGSRNVSPNLPQQRVAPSPPHSAIASFDGRDNSQTSVSTSRPGSRSGSRPSTPSPRTPADSGRLPKTEVDWTALLALNAARRPRPPSRLSSYTNQESLPRASMPPMPPLPPSPQLPSASASGSSTRSNALPYPLDDGPPGIFPSFPPLEDEGYDAPAASQVLPNQPVYTAEPAAIPRPSPPERQGSSYASTMSLRTPRPQFAARHSTSDLPQLNTRTQASTARAGAADPRRVSTPMTPQTRKLISALTRKPLPDCPRTAAASGLEDWYTLIGMPTLQFCPECFDGVFEQTPYRRYFRRSPPHPSGTEVQCALGSQPWIRLAWALTLLQERADLSLFQEVVHIERTMEPCPGHHEAVSTWYTLTDRNGFMVKDLQVCPTDVRRIECLLPSLQGLFAPLPRRYSYDKRICTLHADGNRFAAYVDTLALIHDRAESKRQPADVMPFIELVEQRTRVPECPRDCPQDSWRRWHFHPSVPHLTVCEDCFTTVIEPMLQKPHRSPIAARFVRNAQPAASLPSSNPSSDNEYSDGGLSISGFSSSSSKDDGVRSCQLYSPRMRRVLARALRDNDISYLARRARERHRAEIRMQAHLQNLRHRIRRIDSERRYSSNPEVADERRRFEREIARAYNEWRNEWE